MPKATRKSIPISVQLQVFFRDRWLCYICRRPLIFPFALKQLANLVPGTPVSPQLAYYNLNWRRDRAPLLDELGASIDHVEAFANGGAHGIENFAAICARCNARKNTLSRQEFEQASRPWRVRGKHGEPLTWDGLASVFAVLAGNSTMPLTATERKWLKGLQEHYQANTPAR